MSTIFMQYFMSQFFRLIKMSKFRVQFLHENHESKHIFLVIVNTSKLMPRKLKNLEFDKSFSQHHIWVQLQFFEESEFVPKIFEKKLPLLHPHQHGPCIVAAQYRNHCSSAKARHFQSSQNTRHISYSRKIQDQRLIECSFFETDPQVYI